MKALTHLPTRLWAPLVIIAILAAYPLLRIVVAIIIHAIVPKVVQSLLHVI